MLQPIGLYPFLTKALQFQKLTNFARLRQTISQSLQLPSLLERLYL